MSPPIFELRDVTCCFGDVTALNGVSLDVPAGKTTVLLGPSGGGKSTALRTLLGLVHPSGGQVRFAGEALTPGTVPGLRRKMGYMIQGGGLFPHLTGRENAVLLARVLGWDRSRCDARLATLTELTRLRPGVLDRYPAELSGGQAQRVALMRALMLDPEVLLLDEPLGALDPDTRFDLQADLKAICERLGKTVILVTHDLPEAFYLGDQWVVFREGKVAQSGSPLDVLAKPADDFVSHFVHALRVLPPLPAPTGGATA